MSEGNLGLFVGKGYRREDKYGCDKEYYCILPENGQQDATGYTDASQRYHVSTNSVEYGRAVHCLKESRDRTRRSEAAYGIVFMVVFISLPNPG